MQGFANELTYFVALANHDDSIAGSCPVDYFINGFSARCNFADFHITPILLGCLYCSSHNCLSDRSWVFGVWLIFGNLHVSGTFQGLHLLPFVSQAATVMASA